MKQKDIAIFNIWKHHICRLTLAKVHTPFVFFLKTFYHNYPNRQWLKFDIKLILFQLCYLNEQSHSLELITQTLKESKTVKHFRNQFTKIFIQNYDWFWFLSLCCACLYQLVSVGVNLFCLNIWLSTGLIGFPAYSSICISFLSFPPFYVAWCYVFMDINKSWKLKMKLKKKIF